MAIDTATLKSDLKAAFQAAQQETNPSNRDSSLTTLCNAIADAADKWIKTATVQVTAASSEIAVAGSATNQANPAPISITGSPTDPTHSGGIS